MKHCRIKNNIIHCRALLLLLLCIAASSCQAFSSRTTHLCHLCRQEHSHVVSQWPSFAAPDSIDSESSDAIDTNNTASSDAAPNTDELPPSSSIVPSGWANIGRFLLPSWHSSSDSDAPDITYNSNTSIPGDDSVHKEDSSMDDVIDVECYVDNEMDDCLPQQSEGEDIGSVESDDALQSKKPSIRRALSSIFRGGVKNNSTNNHDTTNLEINDAVIANGTESETSVDMSSNNSIEDTTNTAAEESSNKSQKQNRRSRQSNNAFLTSLESKDINDTTRSKQRKWARRQRRLVIMAKTVKNAMVLFVVTFLMGNVMNQFVDLDEDGSFEVRFGNVLSSSSSPPSSTPATPAEAPATPTTPSSSPRAKSKNPRNKPLFQTVTTPKQNYFTDMNTRSQGMTLVARAVRHVGPAVVRVDTETDLDAQESSSEGFGGERVFENGNGEGEDRGDVFDGVPEAPPPSDSNSDSARNIDFGQGSGMIVNKEGYILTNAHVVDGSSRIFVTLTDGRRFQAELQGSDDIVDIAVLKIVPDSDLRSDSISNIPVAQLGNSDQLEVGQFVTAIGCPGGLDNTCTIGIISGLKRCPNTVGIPDKMGVLDYIQTDAAINQGNSGGPLVDVESGNIVGINTCIRANMEGTSFAIPTNKILAIVDDLAEGKRITHGYLGVHMVSKVNLYYW